MSYNGARDVVCVIAGLELTANQLLGRHRGIRYIPCYYHLAGMMQTMIPLMHVNVVTGHCSHGYYNIVLVRYG